MSQALNLPIPSNDAICLCLCHGLPHQIMVPNASDEQSAKGQRLHKASDGPNP